MKSPRLLLTAAILSVSPVLIAQTPPPTPPVAAAPTVAAPPAGPNVICDFDIVSGWEKNPNGPSASFEADTTFTGGKGAIKFNGPGEITTKVTSPKPLAGDKPNEGFEGFSFWAKGDGSDFYGTVLIIAGVQPLYLPYRYAYAFPLKSTEWKKYTVAWADLVPEDPARPFAAPGSAVPSAIQFIKIGSHWAIWWNNKPVPKHSYSIGRIELEPTVPAVAAVPALTPLADVVKKLTDKKPVHILCLGDSITAGTSLQAPDQTRYAQVLQGLLRQKFGYEDITVESHGVGGAQGNDLRLWVTRDVPADPAPDLVTVMFGYNDKTWDMAPEYYTFEMSDLIDRIARQTGGKSAVVLLPPIPGKDSRFIMMDDYAQLARDLAKSRGITIADVNQVFKALGREGINKVMADQAHPNPEGHKMMANTIADTLK